MTAAARLFVDEGRWHVTSRYDARVLALADRHYSRQTPGSDQFLPPGERLCMLTDDGLAVWGVVSNLDPAGTPRWRVTIFRREGGGRASDLIREATRRTYLYWLRHYGRLPHAPLTTEVDPRKTRRKRDPGRCFLRAGWRRVGIARGLVVLRAPELEA